MASLLRLKLVAGPGEPTAVDFTAGEAVGPLAVGRAGPWTITAAGVLDTHAYLYFDGAALMVQSASDSATVLIGGVRVPATWTPMHPGSELVLGAARMRFEAVEMPSVPPPAPPAQSPLASSSFGGQLAALGATTPYSPAAHGPRPAAAAPPPESSGSEFDDVTAPQQQVRRDGRAFATAPPVAQGHVDIRLMPGHARPPEDDIGATKVQSLEDILASRKAPPGGPSPGDGGFFPPAPPVPFFPPANSGFAGGPPPGFAGAATPGDPGATKPGDDDPERPKQPLEAAVYDVKKGWRTSSMVRKITIVLGIPAAIGAVLVTRSDAPSAPRRSRPAASASASAPLAPSSTAPASEAAVATPTGAAPAATGAAPATPAAPTSAPAVAGRPQSLSTDGAKSLERQAADAIAAGAFDKAADLYDQLAKASPDNRAFSEAARIARAKAAKKAP